MTEIEEISKQMEEEGCSETKKQMRILHLLPQVDDLLVAKFFDLDSEKMLDKKIEVLTQLKNGVTPADIPDYYSILELYPDDGRIWD